VVFPKDDGKTLLEVAQAAHIKCENDECGWKCGDNTQLRRKIAEAASYHPTSDGLPGHVGFHYNVLCNWRKPLWEIVLIWLEAQAAMQSGNTDPLRQFIQKRLAEAWEEDLSDNRKELIGDGYLLTEYTEGQKIDEEAFRFMTVDKQRDHFWVIIRAWRSNGSSRLLYFGRVETFEQVDELRGKMRVEPKLVFVDSAYDTDIVYHFCAMNNWTALRGSPLKSFPYRKQNGDTTQRPFTRFAEAQTTGGKRCRYAHWSSDRVKDILHAHRTGQAGAWEIPDQAPGDYLAQVDAESKREIKNAKTQQIEYRWVKIRRDNHAWDCEAMQIVAAMMLRMIPGFDV
jgi:hypothetical protein